MRSAETKMRSLAVSIVYAVYLWSSAPYTTYDTPALHSDSDGDLSGRDRLRAFPVHRNRSRIPRRKRWDESHHPLHLRHRWWTLVIAFAIRRHARHGSMVPEHPCRADRTTHSACGAHSGKRHDRANG